MLVEPSSLAAAARFRRGDLVVCQVAKCGTHPSPRARQVLPSKQGEQYRYFICKYWMIVDVDGGRLLVRTRRGKERWVAADTPTLHRARWWERWLFASRFPKPDGTVSRSG